VSRVNKPTRRWFDIFVEDFKTSLGTILTFGDIQDGEYLVRSGDKVVGGSGGGGGGQTDTVTGSNGITNTGDDVDADLEPTYGNAANTVCEGNDTRLSDVRIPTGAAGGDLSGTYPDPSVADDSHSHTAATLPATMVPTVHAPSHENGGGDEISVVGLSGVLADNQNAVPAAGIDTTAIHTGDAAGGGLGGTYPDPTVTAAAGLDTTAVHGGDASPDIRALRETGDPQILTMGAVANKEVLTRSGNTIIGSVPTAPIAVYKAFHTDPNEWGTDHDFAAAGTGDVFNGWTFGSGVGINGIKAEFVGGELLLEGTPTGGATAGIGIYKDFVTTLPLDLWPTIGVSRKWNGTGSTTGGGGGANCNNWILIGESSDTYRFMLRYYINSAGGYVSNVQSNLAISETGSNFLNAWIGAFSIEDKVVLDQEDVLGYSDVALHSGVLLPVSRANGGTADTNQRCWPTRNELTLRIKTQLVFEAGGLRKLSVTTEELSMLMFGEIS